MCLKEIGLSAQNFNYSKESIPILALLLVFQMVQFNGNFEANSSRLKITNQDCQTIPHSNRAMCLICLGGLPCKVVNLVDPDEPLLMTRNEVRLKEIAKLGAPRLISIVKMLGH